MECRLLLAHSLFDNATFDVDIIALSATDESFGCFSGNAAAVASRLENLFFQTSV
jgi:hypothetical protein